MHYQMSRTTSSPIPITTKTIMETHQIQPFSGEPSAIEANLTVIDVYGVYNDFIKIEPSYMYK